MRSRLSLAIELPELDLTVSSTAEIIRALKAELDGRACLRAVEDLRSQVAHVRAGPTLQGGDCHLSVGSDRLRLGLTFRP